MNYELTVKGQRMTALRSAKSLLDCHLLRQQYSKQQKKHPVKKIQNFEFSQLSSTQTQLSTNRSKRNLQTSQQRSRKEKRLNGGDLFQFSESCQNSLMRLNSPSTLKAPNLQFNLHYHLKMLKFKEPHQSNYWQEVSQNPSPRVFVNRVYKVKKNDPKQQFFIECSKYQQD